MLSRFSRNGKCRCGVVKDFTRWARDKWRSRSSVWNDEGASEVKSFSERTRRESVETWEQPDPRIFLLLQNVSKGLIPEFQLISPSACLSGGITFGYWAAHSVMIQFSYTRTDDISYLPTNSCFIHVNFSERVTQCHKIFFKCTTLVSFYEPGKMNRKIRPSFQ